MVLEATSNKWVKVNNTDIKDVVNTTTGESTVRVKIIVVGNEHPALAGINLPEYLVQDILKKMYGCIIAFTIHYIDFSVVSLHLFLPPSLLNESHTTTEHFQFHINTDAINGSLCAFHVTKPCNTTSSTTRVNAGRLMIRIKSNTAVFLKLTPPLPSKLHKNGRSNIKSEANRNEFSYQKCGDFDR